MNTRTVLKIIAAVGLPVAVLVAAELSPWFKTYGTGIVLCLLFLIAIGGAALELIAWFGDDTEDTSPSRALRTDNTPHLPIDPRSV